MELQKLETVVNYSPKITESELYMRPPIIVAGVMILACIVLALAVSFVESRERKKKRNPGTKKSSER